MAVLAFPAKLEVRLAIGSDRQRPGSLKTLIKGQKRPGVAPGAYPAQMAQWPIFSKRPILLARQAE